MVESWLARDAIAVVAVARMPVFIEVVGADEGHRDRPGDVVVDGGSPAVLSGVCRDAQIGGGRRVDRDSELDAPGELPREGVGDQRAQPRLELLLDELVRGRDEGSVLDQAKRPGQLEPGALVRLDLHVGEVGQGAGPHVREVVVAHRPVTRAPHM